MGASRLVAVTGANAPHGGADGVLLAGGFERRLFRHVPGEDHVGAVADQQVLPQGDRTGPQLIDLLEERGGIDHHPRRDDRGDLGPQHAHRQERQLVGLSAEHHRVTGVVPSLITHHNVVLFGQQVDNLTLGFVSPLEPDDGGRSHVFSEVSQVAVGQPQQSRAGTAAF